MSRILFENGTYFEGPDLINGFDAQSSLVLAVAAKVQDIPFDDARLLNDGFMLYMLRENWPSRLIDEYVDLVDRALHSGDFTDDSDGVEGEIDEHQFNLLAAVCRRQFDIVDGVLVFHDPALRDDDHTH